VVGEIDDAVPDVERLGRSLFTDFVFAFEITSVLLVIAVVGAILLARRPRGDEIVDEGQQERAAEIAERMAAAEDRVDGGYAEAEPEAEPDADDAAHEEAGR
jgi:NADH-quinone oxidoreductase subunit J